MLGLKSGGFGSMLLLYVFLVGFTHSARSGKRRETPVSVRSEPIGVRFMLKVMKR